MKNFKVGDRVRIISNESESDNPIFSVGIISFITYNDCRVVVKGHTDNNTCNWSHFDELELVEEE